MTFLNDPVVHQIIFTALVAIAAGIGVLAGKFFNARILSITDGRIRGIVDGLVRAAAQSVPDKGDRYAWVAERLAAKFRWLKTGEIEELIEAAVYRLKLELKAQEKVIPAPATTTPDPTKAA